MDEEVFRKAGKSSSSYPKERETNQPNTSKTKPDICLQEAGVFRAYMWNSHPSEKEIE